MKRKSNNDGIRIVKSGISVYEVEIDLGRLFSAKTNQLNGFPAKLLRMFPALKKHECYAGEAGGFALELKQGTDLAHVMEHLTLELLKAAARPRREFSGWTRRRGSRYIIHFQTPDSSMGHCAVAGAKTIVEGIIGGRRVDTKAIIQSIRDSKEVVRCK
jgi:cyanophycin synthetase